MTETRDALQRLYDIASELANGNDVELCWFLRGVFDGVQNAPAEPEPPAYEREYRIGHKAGREFDAL